MSNLESFVRSVESDSDLREFQDPVRGELEDLQRSMADFFRNSLALLQGVGSYLLGVRGKMFRPTVLLLISKMGTSKRDDTIFAATVVELIHLATLIHDDTIDRSAVRRGLPTLNAMYNDQVATILGDYIYTKAFCELIDRDMPRLVPVIAKTTHRMTAGEVLAIEQKRAVTLSEKDYFHLLDEKTASLMGAAARSGAILAGMSDEAVEEMTQFGENLGRAYQVTDDLFDYIGSEGQLGKGVGSDLSAGKITLPLIHALQNVTVSSEREFLQEITKRGKFDEGEWNELLGILRSCGALEYTRDTALGLARTAVDRLGILPEGIHRGALEKAVAYAVQRIH
ncbi:MAG: polyprenyl synthetase family protein [Candidatus Eisenbacteria bacterium]